MHDPCGPSSQEGRKACPGSLEAEDEIPDFESSVSREGTELHELVEECIKSYLADGGIPVLYDRMKHILIDGKPITHEQISCVRVCLSMAVRAIERFRENGEPKVMTEFALDLHCIGCQYPGTADLIIVAGDRQSSAVLDWKFGRNPVKPASENLQGRAYAAGIFDLYPEMQACTVCFVQPRVQG